MFNRKLKNTIKLQEEEIRRLKFELKDANAQADLYKMFNATQTDTSNKLLETNTRLIEWCKQILKACEIVKADRNDTILQIPVYREVSHYDTGNTDAFIQAQQIEEIYVPAIKFSFIRDVKFNG